MKVLASIGQVALERTSHKERSQPRQFTEDSQSSRRGQETDIMDNLRWPWHRTDRVGSGRRPAFTDLSRWDIQDPRIGWKLFQCVSQKVWCIRSVYRTLKFYRGAVRLYR